MSDRPADGRLAEPPTTFELGHATELEPRLRTEFAEEGHVGLVLAGYRGPAGPLGPVPEISAAIGWADLDAGEPITARHRFPAYSVTKLVTVVAVLRLVATGRLALDQQVNDVLTSYRLGADDVTVRELLCHTGGVESDFPHWVDEVGPAAELLGPVLAVDASSRGRHVYSNGGYTTLGQLVADVTGRDYTLEVAEEVLRPLGMDESDFPLAPPWPAPGVASGHGVVDGRIVGCPRQICSVPPAGGLWTTRDDLARFAIGWTALLPPDLVAEALRPQAERAGGGAIGLGFLVAGEGADLVWGHAGGGVGYQSSLLCRPADELVAVALSNRSLAVEPLASQVLQALRSSDVG